MAGNNDNNRNEFKEKSNNWWKWTLAVVVIVSLLLMIFGKRSVITADEDTPTNFDPAPMNQPEDGGDN